MGAVDDLCAVYDSILKAAAQSAPDVSLMQVPHLACCMTAILTTL